MRPTSLILPLALFAATVAGAQTVFQPSTPGAGFNLPPTATVGQTLTGPSGAGTYQWKRGASNISAATNQTYTVQSADAGNTLTLVATSSGVVVPGGVSAANFFFPDSESALSLAQGVQ